MIASPQDSRIAARWPRRVSPELLDYLPTNDPRAVCSRRDLRRINRIMGAHSLLLGALDVAAAQASSMRLVELGAGDGTMLLRLARSRWRQWLNAHVTLLDLRPAIGADTLAAIRALGWSVEVIAADVLDWLARAAPDRDAVVFANLFVHHFSGERLARLLAGIAAHSRFFVCCEPRRSALALGGSHLLGLIGCNDVTRHDAVVSVHAGFRDRELSDAWPATPSGMWTLSEAAARAFSHLFVARRER
jgi:hypothetical protein